MLKSFKATLYTAFTGYIVQAVVVNFPPLLFITFQDQFGITLSQLSVLIFMTFAIQFAGDMTLPTLIRKLGTRVSIVTANFLAASGLILMSFLPVVMPNAYAGLVISAIVYSFGASLIEVLISPIVEACPFENKSGIMSLLHSFFSWGSVIAVLFSTVFFLLAGEENWQYLCLLWAIVPIVDGLLFTRVPLAELPGDKKGHETNLLQLMKKPLVWLLFLLMFTGAASELAVGQWASAFAERGLGVSKTMGDLLGPMLFGVLMGLGRVIYSKFSDKLDLEKVMLFCAALCAGSYLLVALSPWPIAALIGCGLVGFGSGMLWPGTLSIGAKKVPLGGTALFAALACFGDLGCAVGPSVVGFISDSLGGNLEIGILISTAFPVIAIIAVLVLMGWKKSEN